MTARMLLTSCLKTTKVQQDDQVWRRRNVFRRCRSCTGNSNVKINDNVYLDKDRLHQQHWMIRLAFGSNFDAPVEKELEKGIVVLDSACGNVSLSDSVYSWRCCNTERLFSFWPNLFLQDPPLGLWKWPSSSHTLPSTVSISRSNTLTKWNPQTVTSKPPTSPKDYHSLITILITFINVCWLLHWPEKDGIM